MNAEDIIEVLAERPFVPVRLRLVDGRFHEIRHPEQAVVTRHTIAIAMGGDTDSGVAERIRLCSTEHVVEVEPVTANGQGT